MHFSYRGMSLDADRDGASVGVAYGCPGLWTRCEASQATTSVTSWSDMGRPGT
jgi:hypothetical protein